jgi:hypothetical protein
MTKNSENACTKQIAMEELENVCGGSHKWKKRKLIFGVSL